MVRYQGRRGTDATSNHSCITKALGTSNLLSERLKRCRAFGIQLTLYNKALMFQVVQDPTYHFPYFART